MSSVLTHRKKLLSVLEDVMKNEGYDHHRQFKFDMGHFNDTLDDDRYSGYSCRCVLGVANLLMLDDQTFKYSSNKPGDPLEQWLGIGDRNGLPSHVYFDSEWHQIGFPHEISAEYRGYLNNIPLERVLVMLRHWVKTGEIDWSTGAHGRKHSHT